LISGGYNFSTLAAVRMSIFAGRIGLALGLAMLAPAGRTACAQTLTYSSWPVGFHSSLTVGQSSNVYGSFDGADVRASGFSSLRTNFPNGWFVGSEARGINQAAAFGNFGSLSYEGAQFGYNFQSLGGLPVTLYAGLGTLKYDTGIGRPFAPFESVSGTLPGYSARAGVEFQPAPNVSLSLELGYTQSGRNDSDINSLSLPGAAPFALGGRR
jgi:opacity protein-like surface antigen